MKSELKRLFSELHKRDGSFCVILMMLLTSISAWADNVSFIDENGVSQSVDATVLAGSEFEATLGTEDQTTWYVVSNSVTFNNMVTIKGDVRLILGDGKTMTVNGKSNNEGILLEGCLTIYRQTYGTGSLTATSKNCGILSKYSANNLTIYGGTVTATGDEGVGIGCVDLTINGGTVTANGSGSGIDVSGSVAIRRIGDGSDDPLSKGNGITQ